MKPLISRFAPIMLACIAVALAPRTVRAQAPSMHSLTINEPGVYRLHRDIMVQTGDAITINASGVTLDLNGHNISTKTGGAGRGIVVNSAKGVSIMNGKVGSFNVNILIQNSENVTVENVQVAGLDLLPLGPGFGPPPAEIGILLVNTRGSLVKKNGISSVNLGIFVRGGGSTGNRIVENTVTGGRPRPSPGDASVTVIPGLLGICYNPVEGAPASDPGPRGDLIYNNHITNFRTAISATSGSVSNIFRENTLAYFIAAYSPTTSLGNLLEGNLTVMLPAP
jgi:hypothetical protein